MQEWMMMVDPSWVCEVYGTNPAAYHSTVASRSVSNS